MNTGRIHIGRKNLSSEIHSQLSERLGIREMPYASAYTQGLAELCRPVELIGKGSFGSVEKVVFKDNKVCRIGSLNCRISRQHLSQNRLTPSRLFIVILRERKSLRRVKCKLWLFNLDSVTSV